MILYAVSKTLHLKSLFKGNNIQNYLKRNVVSTNKKVTETNIRWTGVKYLRVSNNNSIVHWGVVKRGLPVEKWLHFVLKGVFYPSTFHTENSWQLFHPFLIADSVFNINVRIQRILLSAFQQNASNAILRCCKKCTKVRNCFSFLSENFQLTRPTAIKNAMKCACILR